MARSTTALPNSPSPSGPNVHNPSSFLQPASVSAPQLQSHNHPLDPNPSTTEHEAAAAVRAQPQRASVSTTTSSPVEHISWVDKQLSKRRNTLLLLSATVFFISTIGLVACAVLWIDHRHDDNVNHGTKSAVVFITIISFVGVAISGCSAWFIWQWRRDHIERIDQWNDEEEILERAREITIQRARQSRPPRRSQAGLPQAVVEPPAAPPPPIIQRHSSSHDVGSSDNPDGNGDSSIETPPTPPPQQQQMPLPATPPRAETRQTRFRPSGIGFPPPPTPAPTTPLPALPAGAPPPFSLARRMQSRQTDLSPAQTAVAASPTSPITVIPRSPAQRQSTPSPTPSRRESVTEAQVAARRARSRELVAAWDDGAGERLELEEVEKGV